MRLRGAAAADAAACAAAGAEGEEGEGEEASGIFMSLLLSSSEEQVSDKKGREREGNGRSRRGIGRRRSIVTFPLLPSTRAGGQRTLFSALCRPAAENPVPLEGRKHVAEERRRDGGDATTAAADRRRDDSREHLLLFLAAVRGRKKASLVYAAASNRDSPCLEQEEKRDKWFRRRKCREFAVTRGEEGLVAFFFSIRVICDLDPLAKKRGEKNISPLDSSFYTHAGKDNKDEALPLPLLFSTES
jgi:hypothetical protein